MQETMYLQCGDRGFTNAFVYCVRCLNVAVHRYCLDEIPETVNEFVHWLCDDCNVGVQNQQAIYKNGAIQCRTRDSTASKRSIGSPGVQIKKNVYEGDSNRSHDACTKLELSTSAESANGYRPMGSSGMNDDELVILDEKTEWSSFQQLEKEKIEDNMMQHNESLVDTSLKNTPGENRRATMISKGKQKPNEEFGVCEISECTRSLNDSTSSSNKGERSHFPQKPGVSDPEPGNGSFRSSMRKNITSSEGNLENPRCRTVSAQLLEENKWRGLKTQCSDVSTVQRSIDPRNDFNENRESEITEERTSASTVDYDVPAEPVLSPIWKGSFNIWNKRDRIEGLMAHVSSRACQKVYKEACQFRPVLRFKMLPKSDIWPKSFETSEPSEVKRFFDFLVDEMMHKELAMTAIVQNAELLVFTSTELPLEYWRFRDKYYLWGVFREKQQPVLPPQPCRRESRLQPRSARRSSKRCRPSWR